MERPPASDRVTSGGAAVVHPKSDGGLCHLEQSSPVLPTVTLQVGNCPTCVSDVQMAATRHGAFQCLKCSWELKYQKP